MNAITKYKNLMISERKAEKIMIKATNAAHSYALQNGAPTNQEGLLEFDKLGNIIGYPTYGQVLREELIKRIPEELLVFVRNVHPEDHIEKWNHPFAVMQVFWMGYVDLKEEE